MGRGLQPPIFLEQQEKIWAKPVFNYVFMFFIDYYYYYNIFFIFHVFFFILILILLFFMFFLNFNLPEVGVIFQLHSHQTGCLAHDELLVIREGYHMLIYILSTPFMADTVGTSC